MPFKSKAQREKIRQLVKEGKLSQEEFDKWDKETPEKLPERITTKKYNPIRKPRKVK